ncbi:MAG TPA: carboxylesterase family protein, partial [Polyangiaceae bacterium]|nr:carboxylesterase family protein [Polyangiaceae bacterium]
MNRFWYFLVILLGCRSSDGTAELDAREGYSIAEGSREARAVLQLANTATQDALDGVVGLDARAAEAIVNFRRGADGTEVFETLAELDGVPYVGSAAFEKLLAYAQQENLCGLGLSTEPGFVVTTEGAVRGLEVGETFAFKGIPFAAPPVGKLRWRAPGAPACWAKERPASEFSAECMQQDGQTIHGSEDCLYLNVWTPSSGASTARPVMVYIHGGGNITGDAKGMDLGGGNFLFEGQDLAERADVVVVTVQYRLGVFGFLAHPALAAESPSSSSGNYALRDQLAALQWVRDNIREFGGDPNHVLLFGESAGGLNVSAQIASPLSKGLFAAAIMQSGGYEAKTKAHADSVGEAFVSTTGCDQDAEPLDCLRNLDAVDVVKAVDNSAVGANGKIHTQFGPTVDGVVLLDSPLSVVTKGTHNHVPFVIGVNADETASPLFQIPFTLTQAGYQAAVQAQ